MTAALYTFSFVDRLMLWWLSTLLQILPRAWLALPIGAWTSLPKVPSCEMILPRFLKLSTLANWVLLMVITRAVLLPPGAGWCRTPVFSRLIERPKRFADSEKPSSISCKLDSLCVTSAQSSAKRASWMRPKRDFALPVRRRKSNREPPRRYRMCTWLSGSWTAWAIMHVKMLKRTGARTHPCFTPLLISKGSVASPPVWTWPIIPSWNSWRIFTNFRGHPIRSSTVHTAFLLMISSAFAKLMETEQSGMFCSMHFSCSCLMANVTSTVLRPGLKPHCAWKILFCCRDESVQDDWRLLCERETIRVSSKSSSIFSSSQMLCGT